eukprot:scaffold2205_cov183-Ochromonas_danica.AAC.13
MRGVAHAIQRDMMPYLVYGILKCGGDSAVKEKGRTHRACYKIRRDASIRRGMLAMCFWFASPRHMLAKAARTACEIFSPRCPSMIPAAPARASAPPITSTLSTLIHCQERFACSNQQRPLSSKVNSGLKPCNSISNLRLASEWWLMLIGTSRAWYWACAVSVAATNHSSQFVQLHWWGKPRHYVFLHENLFSHNNSRHLYPTRLAP